MFSFKNLFNKAASTVTVAKDQVLYEDDTGYLFFDIDNNGTVARKQVKAPKPTNLDASDVVSGVFDIARIPSAALERMVRVADRTAKHQLTPNDVQLGDAVQEMDTGLMFFVVNILALDSELGYQEFTAGSAASVPWTGVTNKPSTYAPSAHTHTVSEITDYAPSTTISVTLSAASWSNNTYTISNSAITATNNGYIALSNAATAAQRTALCDADIAITAQAAGSLTLTAYGSQPSVDIPVALTIV